MQILENISLRPYNTFRIEARARYFSTFSSADELEELLYTGPPASIPPLVIGGGSNILFTRDVDGLVLKNEILGREEVHEDAEYIYVKAGGGEDWHPFVEYCINRNWAGLENLSLIPGSVGAAPVQNIGAYGVELRDVFCSLEAFHLQEKKIVNFTLGDCAFDYRDSVFKNKYKNQFVILNLTLRLRKHPVFHTRYGALADELEKMKVKELSIKAISQAVINIRTSKLPDPNKIANAGSFFKNPVIDPSFFSVLQNKYPAIPHYLLADGKIKIPAGWLVEQCGWKGFRKGDAGCYDKQALVLVNYGKASGKEIYDLSEEILQSVKEKFGIGLEREVNIF